MHLYSKIKCPNCNTWNENQDYCSNCNTLINYQLEKNQKEDQKKLEALEAPKDKIDIWLEKIKNSDSGLDKALYWALRSSWFLLLAFVTLAISVLIFGPG